MTAERAVVRIRQGTSDQRGVRDVAVTSATTTAVLCVAASSPERQPWPSLAHHPVVAMVSVLQHDSSCSLIAVFGLLGPILIASL
jgi:hypothetical protein